MDIFKAETLLRLLYQHIHDFILGYKAACQDQLASPLAPWPGRFTAYLYYWSLASNNFLSRQGSLWCASASQPVIYKLTDVAPRFHAVYGPQGETALCPSEWQHQNAAGCL